MKFTSTRNIHQAAFTVRTGLQAGGYNTCMNYCEQERSRCYYDPNMQKGVCDDRYPICQNACTVCGTTPY
jgi:hypothetical protein